MSSKPRVKATATITKLKEFASDKAGNFGIVTAILLPVLIGAAGLAVDVSNAMQVKTQLGAIADSASLAAASALGSKKITTAAQAKALAQDFAKAQLTGVGVDPSAFTISVEVKTTILNSLSNKYEVSVVINGLTDTSLMQVFGKKTMNVANASTAMSSTGTQNSLSMYLVLDRSGSMQASVLASIKNFTTCTYYYMNAAQTTLYSQKNVYPCYNQRIEVLQSSVDGLLATLLKADPDKKFIRTGADAYSSDKFDPQDLDWGTAGVSKYVGEMDPEGGTSSTNAFKEAVDSLLDPMEDSAHKNKNGLTPKKYVLFMTDGENNSSSDNTKTLAQCKRAKDAGVTVYTVGFMLSSVTAKTFMLSCASSATTYYDAQDGSLLNAAFASIATQTAGGLPLLTN
jgi:Flp pilus assembly protein TadG